MQQFGKAISESGGRIYVSELDLPEPALREGSPENSNAIEAVSRGKVVRISYLSTYQALEEPILNTQ